MRILYVFVGLKIVCCEHFGFYRKTNVEKWIEFASRWIELAQICPKITQFRSISLKFAPKWHKNHSNSPQNHSKIASKWLKMCVKLPPLIFAPKSLNITQI
jgi:hypothetical protein